MNATNFPQIGDLQKKIKQEEGVASVIASAMFS